MLLSGNNDTIPESGHGQHMRKSIGIAKSGLSGGTFRGQILAILFHVVVCEAIHSSGQVNGSNYLISFFLFKFDNHSAFPHSINGQFF